MESPHNSSPELGATDTSSASSTAISKAEHQRLFRRGMKWLGLGVFLMGSSFGINFLLFDSDTSFVSIMYVLTSLGALCILKCLADVLGF